MMRLLEVIVALLIVAVLGVLFGVALPDHRHIERSTEVSSPIRQIYDVISGFHSYPSWTALRAYDAKVQLNLVGPDQGNGASVNWVSGDPRIESGSYTITDAQQDQQVKWAIVNDWRGENKQYTLDIKPAANGKTVKITMGYDVDYGWDLQGRYAGMYLEGEPATQIQIHLTKLQDMLATFPIVDYKDTQIDIKDRHFASDPVRVDDRQAHARRSRGRDRQGRRADPGRRQERQADRHRAAHHDHDELGRRELRFRHRAAGRPQRRRADRSGQGRHELRRQGAGDDALPARRPSCRCRG